MCAPNDPQGARGHEPERGEGEGGEGGGEGLRGGRVGGALRACEGGGGREGQGQREGSAGPGAVV